MKPYVAILTFFYLISIHLFAQRNDVTIRRISPPGGYSFQAVHTIKQDVFGYIWMGTFDGVMRYDSKEVIRFSQNSEDENGLPSNRITGISIDQNNSIFVSTILGLCKFNQELHTFERIRYTYENGEEPIAQIRCIAIDLDDVLWMADNQFYGYLDQEKNQMVRINQQIIGIPSQLYVDEENRLWLGTSNGAVYMVHPDENRITEVVKPTGFSCASIYAKDNDVWVGYANGGARLYDLRGEIQQQASFLASDGSDVLKFGNIRKIWKDKLNRLWIGTYTGLFLDNGEHIFRFDPNNYLGIPHNSIFEIFEDKEGGLWFGTWSGGVAYLHHSDNKFNNYRHSEAPTSLSNNMVSSFVQLPNGELYVGTEGGGLNRFYPQRKSFEKIIVGRENQGINIKSMCADKFGGLWLGTAFGGLWHRENGATAFKRYNIGSESGSQASTNGVFALLESDSGIWIGTNGEGIKFYSFKTKKIDNVSATIPGFDFYNKAIRCITIDSKSNLWAGTPGGLFRVHLPSGSMNAYRPSSGGSTQLRAQGFYAVKELSDGKVWIGTKGDGINIYNPLKDSMTRFDANGLLNDKDAYGIEEGENGVVWITSNDGLILYNSNDKSSRRFILTDGIQGNLFNPGSMYKDESEFLYFGGTNGFSQFRQNTIRTNRRAPNLFINHIEVNNRRIAPVQTGINEFAPIVLNPNETTLKFYYSADNFLLPEKNKFKYRLTNYIDVWVEDDSNGSATFVNLPAGDYVLEVKACNNDGIWNEIPATLPIEIKQFWYKSDVAKGLYMLFLLIIISLFIRFYVERARLKKTILIEKIEREHEDQLHEMKLRFFTNISHEFRTPLTLINWPLKKLIASKNLDEEQVSQLDAVQRNTNRLLYLINQIMDLRKVEKGQAKLNLTKINLVRFVDECFLNFKEEAKSKNIEFVFERDNNNIVIEADEEKLDKILYNLLSNAFKFAPVKGKIVVEIHSNKMHKNGYFSNQLSFGKLEIDEFVEIAVIDNGIGIDSEDLPKIFNRYEQGKQKRGENYSTGIGLNLCKEYTLMHQGEIIVQSTPGAGTRFAVRLPIKQKAQKIFYESHQEVKNIKSWESTSELTAAKDVTISEDVVLIVEDNNDLRKFMQQFLKDHYKVLTAKNGQEGLDALENQNVQLVISDVMMPVMDGFEFCQLIKSQLPTCHIPVILLTALSSKENNSTGLEKGADAYITKPFDENVLLSQIRNLLQQRQRLQESYMKKFISKQPIDTGSLDSYFLNKVNTAIVDNIGNENFSVEILAEELGFSRSQLHRKLKQISNYTSSEYIMMVKIREATTILSTRQFTIDEVAYKTGFNSHSYFTKCFKKIHQQSPKEFLKTLS